MFNILINNEENVLRRGFLTFGIALKDSGRQWDHNDP